MYTSLSLYIYIYTHIHYIYIYIYIYNYWGWVLAARPLEAIAEPGEPSPANL